MQQRSFGQLGQVSALTLGGGGITGVGWPSAVLETIADPAPPAALQCITNLLDSPGGMQSFPEPARPREIIAAAAARGIGVMGIRAVQAGAPHGHAGPAGAGGEPGDGGLPPRGAVPGTGA